MEFERKCQLLLQHRTGAIHIRPFVGRCRFALLAVPDATTGFADSFRGALALATTTILCGTAIFASNKRGSRYGSGDGKSAESERNKNNSCDPLLIEYACAFAEQGYPDGNQRL
jgi:hypothetical protein